MYFLIFFLCLPYAYSIQTGGVLQIDYPNVVIQAQDGGNITTKGGPGGGNVYLTPGAGGVVFFEDVDFVELMDMIKSMPPVWIEHSPTGFYGTYYGGDRLNVKLEAKDPEGSSVTYKVVAGMFPVGVTLDEQNGVITGIAPDEEALYVITIRAIDSHDKFADAVYTMETHEKNQCMSSPCVNGGICSNGYNDYNCTCPVIFGGKNCQTSCSTHALGVANKNVIPDAHITAYRTRPPASATSARYYSYHGRLGMSGNGWCGISSVGSWLQIDLGGPSRVFAVALQGVTTTLYTNVYHVAYSLLGTTFTTIQTPGTNTTQSFTANTGSTATRAVIRMLPSMVETRFIRFLPQSWYSGSFPCMRVEVYGCSQ